MTTNKPHISVLMPVYNGGRYLAGAMQSILDQTYRDFELITVDDGSTDDSLEQLNRIAAKDERVKVISRPNTGIVGALNDAFDAAEGSLIGRMDDDDLCEPNRFELQIARLESDASLVCVGSCGRSIDPDGRPIGAAPLPLTHEEIEAAHLAGVSSIFHPAVLIRRKAYEAAGGYREGTSPAEDFDLWLRLGEQGRLANLPEPLFIWRRTLNGIFASTTDRQTETLGRILADTWSRRNLPGKPPELDRRALGSVDLIRQWGWQALKSGNVPTARACAGQSIRRAPLAPASWRLWYCALRGR